MRRVAWLAVCVLALIGGVISSASADAEISTIYLQNGGKVRGEIVVDVPGTPLTVVVAGQAMQITRESIARIDGPAAAPSTAPAAPTPPPTPAPVAPPVYAPAPVAVAPIAATTPTVPSASVVVPPAPSTNLNPQLQQLMAQRNDVSSRMKRAGIGKPIMGMAVGAVAIISTAIATTIVYNDYTECVASSTASSYESCRNDAPLGMGVGYGFGSAMLAVGTTALIVNIVKRKSLQRRLAVIDQDLRRLNVAPIARLNAGGLSLRAAF